MTRVPVPRSTWRRGHARRVPAHRPRVHRGRCVGRSVGERAEGSCWKRRRVPMSVSPRIVDLSSPVRAERGTEPGRADDLTVEKILAWADEHRAVHGTWPEV